MSDTFNVTAAYDKESYVQGETITVAITGDNTHVEESIGQAGPIDITVQAEGSGAQHSFQIASAPVAITTTTHEAVRIISAVDTGPTPRTWTINAEGNQITATA